MSDAYDLTEDGQQDDNANEGMVPRSQIRQLEKKASRADDLEKRLAEFERRDAFREAGIDLSDPKSAYFVKGYDGEVTPEAIRKAGEEAGFITPPPPSPAQAEGLSAEQRLAAAATGAAPAGAANEDAIRSEMTKAMQEGGMDAMLAKGREYGMRVSDDFM